MSQCIDQAELIAFFTCQCEKNQYVKNQPSPDEQKEQKRIIKDREDGALSSRLPVILHRQN